MPYSFSTRSNGEVIQASWFNDLQGAVTLLLESTINARDYGAVGDGITDDTTALQAAINAAISDNVPLYLPPGNYLTGALTAPKRIVMFGYGVGGTATDTMAPSQTRLLAKSGTGSMLTLGTGTGAYVQYNTLENLYFDGQGNAQNGIYIPTNGGVNAKFSHLLIKGCVQNGVLNQGAGAFLMEFDDVYVSGGQIGFNLILEVQGSTFTHCQSNGASVGGMRINAGSNTNNTAILLNNCTFENSAGYGVQLLSTELTAVGTYCESNVTGHFSILSGSNPTNLTIMGGTFLGNDRIVAMPTSNVSTATVTLIGGKSSGLTAGGPVISSGQISGNTVEILNHTVVGTANNKTRNAGTATLTSGTTSIVVNHGLLFTPAAPIVVTPTTSLGSAATYWVDSVTATQFTIHVNVDPGAAVTFGWEARINP